MRGFRFALQALTPLPTRQINNFFLPKRKRNELVFRPGGQGGHPWRRQADLLDSQLLSDRPYGWTLGPGAISGKILLDLLKRLSEYGLARRRFGHLRRSRTLGTCCWFLGGLNGSLGCLSWGQGFGAAAGVWDGLKCHVGWGRGSPPHL